MEQVFHPDHYQTVDNKEGGYNIECIDAMIAAYGKEAVMTFCKINAFKYIWRSDKKGGPTDIKKAIWYLKEYLELQESLNNQIDS